MVSDSCAPNIFAFGEEEPSLLYETLETTKLCKLLLSNKS